MSKVSIIDTEKTVSQTLADLRVIFKQWAIEEWEPIPDDDGRSYSVRYLRGNQWTVIASRMQPTKSMNLRVCYQVIKFLKLWENRGVTGIAKGVTFVGGALVAQGREDKDSFEESCAVLGVSPDASLDEIEKTYRVKAQFYHPDTKKTDAEKQEATERFKRIQRAYDYLKKIKTK